MAQSQRVLSGSKTKGSRVTGRKDLIPFYQGLNVKTIADVGERLNPQLRSGDLLGIFKDGKRMRPPQFDDTITINNTLNDLREDDDLFEQRLVFDFEKANFGQPPETPQGEPFADLLDYNPISYIEDPGVFMWPVNLWNLGELPNHEYDGLAEVFDKRASILGRVDLRYEGKTTRGALIGAASERPWGSKEITDKWKISDNQEYPFLDAPLTFTSASTPPNGPNAISQKAIQAFQNISQTPDDPMTEEDYHDKVYFSLISHNNQDMQRALRLLNSSSCQSLTNPYEKMSQTGFYFGHQAGSITFGDSYILGEYE